MSWLNAFLALASKLFIWKINSVAFPESRLKRQGVFVSVIQSNCCIKQLCLKPSFLIKVSVLLGSSSLTRDPWTQPSSILGSLSYGFQVALSSVSLQMKERENMSENTGYLHQLVRKGHTHNYKLPTGQN